MHITIIYSFLLLKKETDMNKANFLPSSVNRSFGVSVSAAKRNAVTERDLPPVS